MRQLRTCRLQLEGSNPADAVGGRVPPAGLPFGDDGLVMTVRATRRLLDHLGRASTDLEQETTLLGEWYATALPWRPRQVALMMSDQTLLPVLLPLAPAATLLARFPAHLGTVLGAHGVPDEVIQGETEKMRHWQLAPTNNRSRLGSLNEFASLANHARDDYPGPDLTGLSMWLSTVPCSPLYKRHVSPDRELAALVERGPEQGV